MVLCGGVNWSTQVNSSTQGREGKEREGNGGKGKEMEGNGRKWKEVEGKGREACDPPTSLILLSKAIVCWAWSTHVNSST